MTDLLIPHLTEKTQSLAQNLNVFVFKADKSLNKDQIKEALEKEYKVEVVKLRTQVQQGKKARSIHLKARSSLKIGRRKTYKKAYVQLKPGETIPVFADFTKEADKK